MLRRVVNMASVLVPVLFLILVSVYKKIPLIGGNLVVAFLGAGFLALFMGHAYDPSAWFQAWLASFNSIAFIFYIIIFGSIFSSLQIKTGAMGVILNILRAAFGRTPQGLILAILITLYFGGSLMGTVAAVGAVVGILVAPILHEMGMNPDLVCATIVTGASMGGMMPPVSNAVILASGLTGIDPEGALMISYVTTGIGLVLVALFFCKVYVGDHYAIPEDLIPKESPLTLFRRDWFKLVPFFVLMLCVFLNSMPGIKFDLPRYLLSLLPGWNGNFYASIKKVYFIGKITNNIVLSMLAAIITTYICNPGLFSKKGIDFGDNLRVVAKPELILVATAFFLGAFKLGGQNMVIMKWAKQLDSSLLIIGGAVMLVLAGMLTGGQSTAQSMLLPILDPAWQAIGISKLNITLASAHLGMAGQGLPPADMNTFIIAGLVGALLGKPVNPMKSMIYSSPYCIYLLICGLYFLV
jgi:TRAP-type C4-dicarboxylate transport system permease large subunit